MGRAIENTSHEQDLKVFEQFAKGLALLDDYDHEALDQQGLTIKEAIYPEAKDYMELIKQMYSDFESSVFANTQR